MNIFKKSELFLIDLAVKVLGPSWKTTLAGYGQLFAATAYKAYEAHNGKSLTQHDVITLIVSGGVAVALRFAKDEGIKVPDSVYQKVQDKVVSEVEKTLIPGTKIVSSPKSPDNSHLAQR